jgi:hypothetical protein
MREHPTATRPHEDVPNCDVRVDECHRGRGQYPLELFTDEENRRRYQRLKGALQGRCTRLHEQWSSTRLGLVGFGAYHPGETCRVLRTWASARGCPTAVLARQERFVLDIVATVLSVLL